MYCEWPYLVSSINIGEYCEVRTCTSSVKKWNHCVPNVQAGDKVWMVQHFTVAAAPSFTRVVMHFGMWRLFITQPADMHEGEAERASWGSAEETLESRWFSWHLRKRLLAPGKAFGNALLKYRRHFPTEHLQVVSIGSESQS